MNKLYFGGNTFGRNISLHNNTFVYIYFFQIFGNILVYYTKSEPISFSALPRKHSEEDDSIVFQKYLKFFFFLIT
jgi:hypothetical protein